MGLINYYMAKKKIENSEMNMIDIELGQDKVEISEENTGEEQTSTTEILTETQEKKIENLYIIANNHEKLNEIYKVSDTDSKGNMIKKLGLKWFHILRNREIITKYDE